MRFGLPTGGRSPGPGGRGRRSPARRCVWQSFSFPLLVLTINCALLFTVGRRFPLETVIVLAIFGVAAIGVALYVGELVIVDFILWITTPIMHEILAPLEYEQVGEMTIAKLSDDIVSVWQCQAFERQLKRLIDEHHCDLILDFSGIGRLSSNFRGVLIRLTTAARREAEKLGSPYRPVAVPPDELFRVFADRKSAVEEMGRHDGHGWVVLCSVPVGIRAVSDAV